AKVANKTSRPQDLKTSITASLPRCPTAPLPEMSPYDETLSDYAGTGMTTGPHPLKHLRSSLDRQGVTLASDLHRVPNGKRVRTAGAVTVRQRPGTAKGILFLTLEDESGMSQAIVMPDLLQEQRQLIVRSPGLVVEGVLQKRDGTLSIKADKLWRLPDLAAAPSHDFRGPPRPPALGLRRPGVPSGRSLRAWGLRRSANSPSGLWGNEGTGPRAVGA
ncbi:MAG: OB-fold nucleic acid binding domain-containing protein, partial [Thermoanaerobaculia bacterium]